MSHYTFDGGVKTCTLNILFGKCIFKTAAPSVTDYRLDNRFSLPSNDAATQEVVHFSKD